MTLINNYELYKKVWSKFLELKNISPALNYLISRIETSKKYEIGLFGGAVRDLWLDKIPKDYDIVVQAPSNFFLNELLYGINASGKILGARYATIDKIDFDIWDLDNTWAFREKHFVCSWENLVKSVPFNIQSIVITNQGNVYSEPDFWQGLEQKKIWMMSKKLPYNKKVYKNRALSFAAKYNFDLDDELKNYLEIDYKQIENEKEISKENINSLFVCGPLGEILEVVQRKTSNP